MTHQSTDVMEICGKCKKPLYKGKSYFLIPICLCKIKEAQQSTDVTLEQAIAQLESCIGFISESVDMASNGFDSPPEPRTKFDYELNECAAAIHNAVETIKSHRATLSKPVGEVMSPEKLAAKMVDLCDCYDGEFDYREAAAVIKARDTQLAAKAAVPDDRLIKEIEHLNDVIQHQRHEINARADAYRGWLPAGQAPDGYALVPIEPTEAMMESGYLNAEHTLESMGPDYPSAEQSCKNIYKAMIEASPKPQGGDDA